MDDILIKTENPEIIEVIEKSSKRRYNLSNFQVKQAADRKRYCVWCMKGNLYSRSHKYCSDVCRESAFTMMNPQKEQAIHILLHRQEYKCNICKYDYMSFVEQIREGLRKSNIVDYINKPNYVLIYRLKSKARGVKNKERQIEVDHIIPIALGGQALGLDNHQVICKSCHKEKTKQDLANIAKSKNG